MGMGPFSAENLGIRWRKMVRHSGSSSLETGMPSKKFRCDEAQDVLDNSTGRSIESIISPFYYQYCPLAFPFKTTSGIYLCPDSGTAIFSRLWAQAAFSFILPKETKFSPMAESIRLAGTRASSKIPQRVKAPLMATTRRSTHSVRLRRRKCSLRNRTRVTQKRSPSSRAGGR